MALLALLPTLIALAILLGTFRTRPASKLRARLQRAH
jgi:hypothetical protein